MDILYSYNLKLPMEKAKIAGSLFENNPINRYILDHSLKLHPVQEKLIEQTLQHERKQMLGDPICQQLLTNLMKCIKAKRVLDVGVFTGFSSLSAALAIPEDGKVVALDVSEEYTSIAKTFWEEAGVSSKIDLYLAPALDTMDGMIANGETGQYDFAFIDADKENYCNYFDRCLKLVRSGGIIAFDNVLWYSNVINPSDNRSSTVGIREVNKKLKECDKVDISMMNIGDGLTLAFVK